MADFKEFWNALTGNIKEYATSKWKDYLNDVISDGNAFLDKTKEDIKRWTIQLSKKELTKKDFEWLLEGKKDLAEMEALKQKGLDLAEIERCRDGLLNVVLNTALNIFT